jgi:hypothetical protein
METCPKCGYVEPPTNIQYRGHIMSQYKNKDTGEVGMFNDDRESFEIPPGPGRVAGNWVKVGTTSVADTASAIPPTVPKQEIPVKKAPVIPQNVPVESPVSVRVPSNI